MLAPIREKGCSLSTAHTSSSKMIIFLVESIATSPKNSLVYFNCYYEILQWSYHWIAALSSLITELFNLAKSKCYNSFTLWWNASDWRLSQSNFNLSLFFIPLMPNQKLKYHLGGQQLLQRVSIVSNSNSCGEQHDLSVRTKLSLRM